MEPELVEDGLRGADLTLATVDDDEVGHRPAALLLDPLLACPRRPEPAAEDLLVAREVVRPGHRPDPEPAVLAGARLAVFEDDHAADRFAPLRVADVVALDAKGRSARGQNPSQVL